MSTDHDETLDQLNEAHRGSNVAFASVVQSSLPWLHAHVRARLGPALRSKAETGDFVQLALIELLRYGPKVIADEPSWRKLLCKIVENVLRDQHDWFHAKRRAISRERPILDTVLSLDPAREAADTPSQIVDRNEHEAWVRLGMELLDPEERSVLVLREWEQDAFPKIGKKLGISEDAARRRYRRGLRRLATKVRDLRAGRIDAAIQPGEEAD